MKSNLFLSLVIGSMLISNVSFCQDKKIKEKEHPIEFKFTEEELKQFEKWKDKSHSHLWEETHQWDRSTFYVIGLEYFKGSTNTDLENAKYLFSVAASLGFAPSIKQILDRNISEKNNFHMLVYSNLLCLLGHQEFSPYYKKIRAKMQFDFGFQYCKDAEKVVYRKLDLINRNAKELESCSNKKKFILSMANNELLIDSEDADYLKWAAPAQPYVEDLVSLSRLVKEEIKEFNDQYQETHEMFSTLYTVFKKGMMTEKYSNKMKSLCLDHAIKTVDNANKLITMFEEFKNTSCADTSYLTNELILLFQSCKGVLEYYTDAFSSPDKFFAAFKSDTNYKKFSKFKQYTAEVNLHSKNIDRYLDNK
jgi:endo-alpha-1,4-polygalactosaminidase (GH114 family)